MLTDYERLLKEREAVSHDVLPTANITQHRPLGSSALPTFGAFTTPCDSSKPIFIPIPSHLPTPLPLPVPQDTPPHDAPPQDVSDQPVPTDVSVSVPPQDVYDQLVPTDVSVSVPVPADGSVSGSVSANESVSIPVSSVPSSSTTPVVSSRPKRVRKPNPLDDDNHGELGLRADGAVAAIEE
nr:hypothetical protein Iba_chr06bCG10550 [Ipomoea batatas]